MHQKIKFERQEIIIYKILIFFIFINFYFPKIDLIPIPGFWQGIRLENIVCFFLLLTMIIARRLTLTLKDYKYLKLYIIFFLILLISTYTGWINEVDIKVVFLLRTLEYLVFCFFLFKSKIPIKTFEKFVKFFYIVCFVGLLLQYLNLMGTFSSKGLLAHNEGKYTAFTSGSWELAIMISISYFIILFINENNYKKLIFYFFITLFILLLTGSRTVVVAFLASNIIFIIFSTEVISKKSVIFMLLILFPIVSIFILNDIQLKSLDEYEYSILENPNDIIGNLLSIDFNYVFQSIKDFLLYGNIRPNADTPQLYTSLFYRLEHWNFARDNFLINGFTIIFGSGPEFIYYDSFIFRILFTTGVIGTLFFMFIIVKIPILLIPFFIISGLTIDFIASYKLTILTIILHYVIVKRKNYENRN